MTKAARLGVPGTGPYMIQSYAALAARARAQPALPGMVRRGTARRVSGPDRADLQRRARQAADCRRAGEGRPHGVAVAGLPAERDRRRATRRRCTSSRPRADLLRSSSTRELPPFDKLAARQAFNYAIDRSKAVAGFGGVDGAAVTCQILPAGMPGYRPYCPYTRNPTGNGAWTGPDLARARKLVAASGTRGQKVVFWTGPTAVRAASSGSLAVATLKQLGYRASLKSRPGDDATTSTRSSDSRTRAQAGFDAWAQDYPAAIELL